MTRAARTLTLSLCLAITLGWSPGSPARAQGSLPPENFTIAFIGDQGLGSNAEAVLQLIGDEGADAVVHSGDFDLQDNPAAWFVIGLQWLDASDGMFGDEKNPEGPNVNYDWMRMEFDLVAPLNARRAVVWLTGHYPGRVTFDKVSIAPIN